MRAKREEYVFGLDIGTRSIVGTLGYRVGTDRFVVVAQVSIEHKTRAVIDGQIHDIPTVAKTIAEVKARLETMTGETLKDVSIAAAGRVLKTKNVYVEYELPSETRVTNEHIHSLDSIAIEKAYEEIRTETDHKDKHFYCVGYSPVRYYLNGYPMEMIEKHMASSIGVEMIATFLPDEVVDGLYSAVEDVGLHVASLTLEPIAAINLAIPERFRLLNIALVDVGAGTSDISIVKDGSIIAFGMIPLAGDEITEAIAQKYLLDFETAEQIKKTVAKKRSISFKNIMDEVYKLSSEEVLATAQGAIDVIVEHVSDKIVELNGGKSVSAVFVVGGGGKMPGFTERMSQRLGLPENRVAIRGAEVLQQIDFSSTGIKKDSMLVTPIGICMEYYEQKSNFIHVRVNGERVKIYDNGKATVLDACIHAGFSQQSLFPSRGEGFKYTVNGNEREAKGKSGEPAEVSLNGEATNLNKLIKEDDTIIVKPATRGENASLMLGKVAECREELEYTLFGKKVSCPKRAEVNGVFRPSDFEIHAGDEVVVHESYSVAQLLEYMGMKQEKRVLADGEEVNRRTMLEPGAVVERIVPGKPVVEKTEKPKPKTPASSGTQTVVSGLGEPETTTGEDPLLAQARPLPSWAADLPIGNMVAKAVPNMGTNAAVVPAGAGGSVQVEVNGTKVALLPKAKHVFVDVFDVYPFDLTKAGGKRMVCRVNGMAVTDFTTPVHQDDKIDLYWEK